MKRLLVGFCLFFGLSAFPLFSQVADTEQNLEAEPVSAPEPVFAAEPAEDSIFVIDSISFDIDGRTRPDAILRVCEIREGEEIRGRANLEKFIALKRQTLLNQRVLESSRLDYTTGERRADGKYPVNLSIKVKDTWNIVILPEPKYSTNTGFELSLKGRDYNFLGTMNPLRVDIGYTHNEKSQNSFSLAIDSDTPFKAFGYNWNVNFDHSFNYRPDVEKPYYYKNTTGLSMELPFRATTFTFGFDESFIVNEENSERDWPIGRFQNGMYMSSHPYITWKIPTRLEIGKYGKLTYTPEISATFNHGFSKWPLDEIHVGPFLTLKHTLGFNRVNWMGNFRQGLDVSMNNSYKYDFHRLSEDADALSLDYTIAAAGHFIITDYFGVSARTHFRQWFYHDPEYYDQAGDVLRGIRDRSLNADYMLSVNLDFPFRILRFTPSEWFGQPKLRFFNFDLHLSPIIDLALYHNPDTNTPFNFKNMLASGGFEVIVFPAFFRSFYLRVSFAWNFVEQINHPGDYYLSSIFPIIPHIPGGDNREIFIGVGHHY